MSMLVCIYKELLGPICYFIFDFNVCLKSLPKEQSTRSTPHIVAYIFYHYCPLPKASTMVVNIPINSTFLTYLAAVSAIMVFPVSTVVQACICVGLAKLSSLLNWSWNVSAINFQPPQSPTNNRLWYIELGRYFLVLVIYGLHVIVRTLHIQIIQQPVLIRMLYICFLELGFVLITLSLCAKDYVKFIVIMYLVIQFGRWHTQKGAVTDIGSIGTIFCIIGIIGFLTFATVWIVSNIYGIVKLHVGWLFTTLTLQGATSMMHDPLFIRSQYRLPRIQLLICFFHCLLLLY